VKLVKLLLLIDSPSIHLLLLLLLPSTLLLEAVLVLWASVHGEEMVEEFFVLEFLLAQLSFWHDGYLVS
jgi:hypothetical protein